MLAEVKKVVSKNEEIAIQFNKCFNDIKKKKKRKKKINA